MEKSLVKQESIMDVAMTPEVVHQQVQLIQKVMKKVMKDGTHYGTVPGCGAKKVLLKPGAETLSATFRLAPKFEITKTEGERGHREYEIITTLEHGPTGAFVAQGVGSCSTLESKYRWRKAQLICPECGVESIIKGKKEYGGGWVCFKAKGGCGSKFIETEPQITEQKMGKTENEDIADTYNTVLKMAKKRSHVDAILTALACSDIFEQDLDEEHIADLVDEEKKTVGQKPKTEMPQAAGKQIACPKEKAMVFPSYCEEEMCDKLDSCKAYQKVK